MQSLLRLILVLFFAAAPLFAGAKGVETGQATTATAHPAASQHHPCSDHLGGDATDAAGMSCDLISGHCAAAALPLRETVALHRAPLPARMPSAPAPAPDPAAPEMETPPPRS